MPQKWTKPNRFALAAIAIFAGATAQSQTLGEPHLNVIPRTDEEAARVAAVTALITDFSVALQFEAMSGGATTVRPRANTDAFSLPSANMAFDRELEFRVGNGLFRKLWVSSPSSTLASDGLGPLYNARSCQRCHLKDGRGHPPEAPDDNAISMFLRISIPGGPDDGIEALQQRISDIRQIVSEQLGPTIGVAAGFNSMDGD